MSGFENYARDTADIETEIVRKGVVLGIDWADANEVHTWACAALDYRAGAVHFATDSEVDYQALARSELFGLAGVMLKTMAKSADQGFESHGGPVWKTFARALWSEARLRGLLE